MSDEASGVRERLVQAMFAHRGVTPPGRALLRDQVESDVDALLDALGLEQVGMRHPRTGSIHPRIQCAAFPHDDCEPVYRLTHKGDKP